MKQQYEHCMNSLTPLEHNVIFSETQQLRTQVSGLLSQQSSSDQIMREIQQREMDLMVSTC